MTNPRRDPDAHAAARPDRDAAGEQPGGLRPDCWGFPEFLQHEPDRDPPRWLADLAWLGLCALTIAVGCALLGAAAMFIHALLQHRG